MNKYETGLNYSVGGLGVIINKPNGKINIEVNHASR